MEAAAVPRKVEERREDTAAARGVAVKARRGARGIPANAAAARPDGLAIPLSGLGGGKEKE